MKHHSGLILLTAALGLGLGPLVAPAAAEICAIDAVPAATLLLPYFEVDLGKLDRPTRGETTTLYINNGGAAPALARVTLCQDVTSGRRRGRNLAVLFSSACGTNPGAGQPIP